MAVLSEIRKRSWLLIGVIGVSLLAFLIGDAFSQGSIFGNPNELGSVAGTPINIQDYNTTYNRLSRNPQMEGAGENILSEMAWNALLSERIVANQMDKLGVGVSEQAYYEAAGRFYNSINPNLVDANGRVNVELTRQFMGQIQANAQAGDRQSMFFYEQWENINPQAMLMQQEYLKIVSSGALGTDVDARFNHMLNNGQANISLAAVKYDEYASTNGITVTDDEINSYIKQYPKRFKIEPTVNLAYAYFPARASEQDIAQLSSEMNAYLTPHVIRDEAAGISDSIQAFGSATDIGSYVTRFSEVPFDSTYYTREQFNSIQDPGLRNALVGANVGDVVGPLRVQDTYQLIKINDSKMITDSAKTSHILIGFVGSEARNPNITRNQEEARVLADSLLTQIRANPALFNQFAANNSDDLVAAQDNGNIGWVGRFQQGFAESYRNFAVNNPRGTIEVVPSQFGYHIIRIDDVKQLQGYQLAGIIRMLNPSEETRSAIFTTSGRLASESQQKSANDFINAARQAGAEVNTADGIKRFSGTLTGLSETRKEADIMRWAFSSDAKSGNLERFETAEGGQVIAYLVNKFSEGQPNVAAHRAEVEPLILQRKVVEHVKQKVGANNEINSIASALGTNVAVADINFSRPNIDGYGSEMRLGGAAMGLTEGRVSEAIPGMFGVYYIRVNNKTAAAAKEDFQSERRAVKTSNRQQIMNTLLDSFVDNEKVKDKRIKMLR
ncbi:MAG: SurA N-terminal domain-containing protein [Weeksellaceae bacterium]|nr:SurA N-terminal domain-containing protein [Weeksellaceae bacterium]